MRANDFLLGIAILISSMVHGALSMHVYNRTTFFALQLMMRPKAEKNALVIASGGLLPPQAQTARLDGYDAPSRVA